MEEKRVFHRRTPNERERERESEYRFDKIVLVLLLLNEKDLHAQFKQPFKRLGGDFGRSRKRRRLVLGRKVFHEGETEGGLDLRGFGSFGDRKGFGRKGGGGELLRLGVDHLGGSIYKEGHGG